MGRNSPTSNTIMSLLGTLGIARNGYTTEKSSISSHDEARMEKLLILSTVITIFYFTVLLGIILFSVFLSYRKNNRRLILEEREQIVIERRKLDSPPSYSRIYFSEEPPQYQEIGVPTKQEETDDVPLISL